ncbi:MAG: RDD family protein [Lautropia sp.]|nr:RDD family protein [Lautropia sp.]
MTPDTPLPRSGPPASEPRPAAAPPYPPASLWRRFMAIVYEGVILFGIVFFFGYAFSALSQYQGGAGPHRLLFQLYLFGVLALYFGWFWSNGRWSLPMKTLGIRLVRDDGRQGPISPGRALWRYTVASALWWGGLALVWQSSPWWLLLFFLPFAWAMIDPRRRTLYDVAAGTLLIHTPLPRAPARNKPRPPIPRGH